MVASWSVTWILTICAIISTQAYVMPSKTCSILEKLYDKTNKYAELDFVNYAKLRLKVYEDMMTLTCCQDHILTENIWFVWYGGVTDGMRDERRRRQTLKPMEAGG